MTNKAVILLSSGLDSLVSLYSARKTLDVVLAITFDYGQKAAKDEINAAKKICEKLNIEHKIIELPFLSQAVDNALTNDDKKLAVSELNLNSMKSVWVPNRNGLFLNIAAVYAEKLDAKYIIFGANKEEAQTFSDNSLEFIKSANELFQFSTLNKPTVLAPLANLNKAEIVNLGISLDVDFSLLKSCYDNSEKTSKAHCGVCESCVRLKNAILSSNNKDLINLLF